MTLRPFLIHRLLTLSLLIWLAGVAQGSDNTVLGIGAGASLAVDAHDNTLLGVKAGNLITNGDRNTLVGNQAGELTTGNGNTMVGHRAGVKTTTGFQNAFFGKLAGQANTTGWGNTYLGTGAGYFNQTGVGNVFVGYYAGANELGSNKLYLANSDTSAPLIYGEFDNHLVGINGALGVGTSIWMDRLHVRDGNLRLEQTGATHATLNFIANGQTWEIKNNEATGRLTFFSPGGGATTASFKFDRQAVENLLRVGVLAPDTVDIVGNLVVTGDITNPDDVFTPEYKLETIEAHAAAMWTHRHLPAVGPGQVNAQGQAMVNVGARSQGMLEELEIAHRYIEQLKGETDHKAEQIAAFTQKVTALKAQAAHVEAMQREMSEKETQLNTLRGEMGALKALVQQLLGETQGAVPGEEG